MNNKVKLMNPAIYEDKRDSEETYKECNKKYKMIAAMKKEAEIREADLQNQILEMQQRIRRYEKLEMYYNKSSNEIKDILNMVGVSLNSTNKQTNQAYDTYEELECYVGVVEKIDYGGGIVVEKARIPKTVYKRDQQGNLVERDIIEMNQYIKDYY